ncbi:DNA gyrase inhibitor YacG [Planctomycetota bacterium]
MKHICPICHKIVKAASKEKSEEAKFFPFCSRRCKFIDLGAWLDNEYKIVSGSQSLGSDGPSDSTPISPDRQ